MVISDHLTTHLIVEHAAFVAPKNSPLTEGHPVQTAIVFNALRLAFHELIQALSFLAVKSPGTGLRGDDAILKALRIFSEFDAISLEHDAAFGDQDMAREHRDLFQVVMHQGIGLNVHGSILVLSLGVRELMKAPTQGHQHEEERVNFQGMNLAELYMPRIVRAMDANSVPGTIKCVAFKHHRSKRGERAG